MMKNTIPEIQRSSLSSLVLQLLATGINPLNFDFLDKPPKEVSFLIEYELYIFPLNLLWCINSIFFNCTNIIFF